MLRTVIIYGSTTRYTEMVAARIIEQPGFENVDLFDIEDITLQAMLDYDFLIFGLPTWDYGEIQSSWQNVWEQLDTLDFSGKIVAFFGLGDQLGYSEWFVDAMGMLHDKIISKGAFAIGEWPVDGYTFNTDISLTNNKTHFVGLAIDEVNQSNLTESRISQWCQNLLESINE